MTATTRPTGFVALMAAALGVWAACAAPAWYHVDPARDTTTAFNHDQYECREANRYRAAHRRWGEDHLSPATLVDEDAAHACLASKGWRRRGSGPPR